MIILYLLGTLILIVIATAKFRIHPFLSLLAASLLIGGLSGIKATELMKAISQGFGNALSGIGIIIALGTIMGTFLEKTGGTKAMATRLIAATGEKKSPLAINLAGVFISIPVFCDSAFVILSSINKELSKKTGIPAGVFAIALAAGLYVSHVFVPPTPGPLAAAAEIGADLGLVILLGLLVAFPTGMAGLVWAKYIGQRITIQDEEQPLEKPAEDKGNVRVTFLAILLPVILIALRSVASFPSLPLGTGWIYDLLMLIGHPVIAMLLSVIIVFLSVVKRPKETVFNWTSSALKEAGLIILITGAGGALGNVLRMAGIEDLIGTFFMDKNLGLFLPFIVAAFLKSAQGSSTIAIITTAAVIAPLTESLGLSGEISKALTVLAIGAGSMTVSHINDSYFWVVSQFSGLDMKSALKSHTMATLIQGTLAILLLNLIQIITG